MKWTRLLIKYITYTITISYLLINQSNQKDIYHSIDGAKWESSIYINEAYFNKSKYYQSESTNFQNLSYPVKNYTVPIEALGPYQDISYKIFEVDANETLNDLKNLSISEYSAKSNIFYDKYKLPYASYTPVLSSSSPIEKVNLNENSTNINGLNTGENLNQKYFLSNEYSKTRSTANSSDSPVKVECNVNYTGLTFDRTTDKITENSLYDSVVNFLSINFVTYKNTAGVYLEKYLNGNIANKTEITNFITNKSFGDFSNIKISKIFPSFLYQRHYLFLLDEQNSKVYLLRINSDREPLKEFNSQINGITLDGLFTFEKEQIDKFDFKNLLAVNLVQEQGCAFFVTQTSLFVVYFDDIVKNIISFNSFQDPDTAREIKFDVIGAAFEKDLCYIAIRNYGLLGFNNREEKFSVIYRHPKIHRIDSFYFEDKNIGLFLNNLDYSDETVKAPNTQEFLLELNKPNYIFKGNYTVNKVFFSNSQTNKADYYSEGVLDLSSSRVFILDRKSNKVYLVGRNIPYQINNIDSFFSLPEELKDKSYKYFNLVSVFEDKSKAGRTFVQGVLLLQTNDQTQYNFSRFEVNTNSKFICVIKQLGTYWFNHQFYTYDNNQLVHYELDKKIKLYAPNEVEGDQTLVVILIIIVALMAIFGLYYGFKKCKQSQVIDSYSNINS